MPVINDKTAGHTTLMLKARVLAVYRATNPGKREFIDSNFESSEYIARHIGSLSACCASTGTSPGEFANDQIDFLPPGSNRVYNGFEYKYVFYVSWDPIDGADSYTFQFPPNSRNVAQMISKEYYHIYSDHLDNFVITATNSVGQSTINLSAPCFLAGSLVQLANGQTKPIEDVRVGNIVIGAFGEENMVIALHRPRLGNNPMCRINGTHSTTNHHPHISVDKQFYSNDPHTVNTSTYGRCHDVINAFGTIVPQYLHGLNAGRVQQLMPGVHLKTVDGSRVVSTIETYALPPETQLYNLVVSGSHTYHVDGYAVTGWPREDDFDYDMWVPK